MAAHTWPNVKRTFFKKNMSIQMSLKCIPLCPTDTNRYCLGYELVLTVISKTFWYCQQNCTELLDRMTSKCKTLPVQWTFTSPNASEWHWRYCQSFGLIIPNYWQSCKPFASFWLKDWQFRHDYAENTADIHVIKTKPHGIYAAPEDVIDQPHSIGIIFNNNSLGPRLYFDTNLHLFNLFDYQ